nr:hypothetical protein CFP56_16586 [Quercus suber]
MHDVERSLHQGMAVSKSLQGLILKPTTTITTYKEFCICLLISKALGTAYPLMYASLVDPASSPHDPAATLRALAPT